MNIKMKKIFGALFAVVALAAPTVSFAATFNNDPQDFATLRVVNYTQNSSCVTCWSSSATANAGDIVSFAIYYHNSGVGTATNVRVKLSPQSTSLGTAHSFSAMVSADNAPAVSGTVVVNTNGNQTVSFLPNGVLWRPNQTVYGSSALPGGQSAGDIFNGVGINIGNIAPGWATQGSVLVRFQTSSVGGTGTTASVPSVTTNSANSVSQNSATLSGYVTPSGANTSAWFEYGTTQSFGYTTSNINYGTSAASFNNTLFNLASNTTYYYRAVAQNSQGTSYGSTLSFTTSGQVYNNQVYNSVFVPIATTNSANPVLQNSATLSGYVTPNGAPTSAWFEWGTNYSLGNSTSHINYGTGATSFNAGLSGLTPNTTYYYRAVAQNSQGTSYGSTLSFTTSGQVYNNTIVVGTAPTANTLLATELTGTAAKLNGLVFEGSGQNSNAWFEWGTSSSLGNKTQTSSVGALPVVKHSDFITGLTSGQTYYYRVVAENTYGKMYGVVHTFVSEVSNYVVTPVVATPVVYRPVTTVIARGVSTQSPVTLTLEGGEEMIGSGEKRTYRVTWKNESSQTLKNVVLRVTFPASMNIDSATKGAFSKADNSVVVDLETLTTKESGDTFIFATTGRGLNAGELLVVTANMVYTETNNVQGDAIAYLTHRAEAVQAALGASVFGAKEFIPTTLFEWILLMILTLILVLLGNHLYGRFSGGSGH